MIWTSLNASSQAALTLVDQHHFVGAGALANGGSANFDSGSGTPTSGTESWDAFTSSSGPGTSASASIATTTFSSGNSFILFGNGSISKSAGDGFAQNNSNWRIRFTVDVDTQADFSLHALISYSGAASAYAGFRLYDDSVEVLYETTNSSGTFNLSESYLLTPGNLYEMWFDIVADTNITSFSGSASQNSVSISMTATAVPEPSANVLLGLAGFFLFIFFRRGKPWKKLGRV